MQDSLILEKNDMRENWSESSLSVAVDFNSNRP